MPFCTDCGHEFLAGARFCAECGARVETVSSPGSRWWTFVVVSLLVTVVVGIIVLRVLGGPPRVNLAKAAPPDTEIWLEIDARPTPSRMRKVRPILKALDDSGLKERLAELALDAETRATWEEDVKPWMGSQYAVAVSGLAEELSSPSPSSLKFLGMATVRDREAAEAVLERLIEDWAGDSDVVRQESRGGLTIYTVEPFHSDFQRRICYALAGRVLYVSGSPEEIAEAVRRAKGRGACLKDTDWYRQARNAMPSDAVAWLAWSGRLVSDLLDAIHDHPGKEALALASAGAMSLDVTGKGVEVSIHQSGNERYEERYDGLTRRLANDDAWQSGLNCIPQDAVGAVAVSGISGLAELWAGWIESGSYGQRWRNAERELDRALGLNIQTATSGISDVSLALLSLGDEIWQADAVAEVRGNDDEEIRDLVERMESALRRGIGVWSPSSEQIESTPCKRINLVSGVGLWYGIEGSSLILASSTDAMTKALRAHQYPSERIAPSGGWSTGLRSKSKGCLLACSVSPPRLAEELSGVLSDRDLATGREALDTAGAVPWVALSATLDGSGCTALLEAELGFPDLCTGLLQTLEAAKRNAVRTVCLSNAKNLALGVLMFTEDHDGRFPHPDSWVDELDEYVRNRDVFRCPADGSKEVNCRYAMNAQLRGMRVSDLADPANTVVFFEAARPGPCPLGGPGDVASPPRHAGGNNYAFADGSARTLERVPNFHP
jgi:prepilin-type processing-associated H-X9-DG protein